MVLGTICTFGNSTTKWVLVDKITKRISGVSHEKTFISLRPYSNYAIEERPYTKARAEKALVVEGCPLLENEEKDYRSYKNMKWRLFSN